MGITSPSPGAILAELRMSLTYILLFLPTARPTGLREQWWCSACLLASDWKQCVSYRTRELKKKKRGLPYYILHVIRRLWSCGETVENILDVPYISKNSQVRSALVLCHAHNVEACRHSSTQ